jgi:competence protein ComEA
MSVRGATTWGVVGLVGAGALLLSATVLAGWQVLPDDAGKADLLVVCNKCHQPERAASVRLTRDGWNDLVQEMIQRGAQGTPEQFAAIVNYLATNFLGEAPKPLNINSAHAIDLEAVAGLTRKEAAAVVAWRDTHGICTALADLKAVPGLDFKKIESRSDFLVCFVPLPVPPPGALGATAPPAPAATEGR